MKKRIALLGFLFLVLFAGIVSGCGRKSSMVVPENSIPFITLINNGSGTRAMLNFWNVKNGKITKTEILVYKTNNQFVDPICWDGESCIVLPSGVVLPDKSSYKEAETINIPGEPGIHGLIGKDYEIVKDTTDNGGYIVKKRNGKTNSYLDVCSIDTSLLPVGMTEDPKNLYVLFCGKYDFQKKRIDLQLATVDLSSGKINRSPVDIPKDVVLPPGPLTYDTVPAGEYFYAPGCCDYLAKIGAKEKSCKKWELNIPENLKSKETAYKYSISGSFKNTFIIVKASANEAPAYDYSVFVFDRNGKFISAMKVSKDSLEVVDEKGNVLSKTTFTEMSRIVFPRTDGVF